MWENCSRKDYEQFKSVIRILITPLDQLIYRKESLISYYFRVIERKKSMHLPFLR